MSPGGAKTIGSGSSTLGAWVLALALAGTAFGQAAGPDLPPGFYGIAPAPFPGPQAPAGVKRLALVYSGCIVGETEPCG